MMMLADEVTATIKLLSRLKAPPEKKKKTHTHTYFQAMCRNPRQADVLQTCCLPDMPSVLGEGTT